MTAVQTCTDDAPNNRNSAASFQVEMPPMPEIGRPLVAGSAAMADSMFRAIGLTAGPQYPPWLDLPRTAGRGVNVSRSTPVIELMVLIRETASAPPSLAARAA